MKKIICFNLIFIILVSFCSCGFTVTKTDNELSQPVDITNQNELPVSTAASEISTQTTVKKKETLPVDSTETKSESQTAKNKTTSDKNKKNNQKTNYITCTFEISCDNILNNRDKLKETKSEFLPENGKVFNKAKITVPQGSTVFDVIKKVCAENTCTDKCEYCKKSGIQLDYVYTPAFDNYYIRGIHQLYEKDCGTQSGWMYSVNGVFPNCGCSQYKIKNEDVICFIYTCNMGEDSGT